MLELSQVQSETCISLLMSTDSSGPFSRQGATRFKNLVQEAEVGLGHRSIREDEIERLLKPAKQLLADTPFWSHQMEGLAVYLEGGTSRVYQLPFAVQDRVVVGGRFHVRPLLKAAVQENFYILNLNLSGAQLLECSEHGVRELVPEGFPESLQEVMAADSSETSSSHQSSPRPDVHHRSGMGMEENRKLALEEWLRSLARSVEASLGSKSGPLVLAGVDYVVAEYRKHDRYPQTLGEAVTGSTERMSHKELEEAGRQKLEKPIKQRFESLLERFQSGLNQGRSASGLEACLCAANAGQVDHLLVAEGTTRWGSFSAESLQVSLLDQEQPDAEELFERVCLDTLKNGGDVSFIPSVSVPNGNQIAAILRFSS
jgi:Bacterial archaeo-eukaryotic release factor family 7